MVCGSSRLGSEYPRKSAGFEIRPLGCRELRAPTWRSLTSLYAAGPPLWAARTGALIDFIALSVQAFTSLSSVTQAIADVSAWPAAESV
jgi:hypothetical protein